MTELERLAIAQAIYKRIGGYVSTKDSCSLRSECDRELLQMFENNGIDRVQVRANGVKVGTLSVRETKGKHMTVIHVTDEDAYLRWCSDNGYMTVDEAGVKAAVESDGIIPDGVEVESIETAPTYSSVLRIDEDAVFEAFGDKLPGAVSGMLEGE